ncbi:MAG: hypothetical protein JRJ14_11090 [Deltaproteobacteria bacterium]|nr:hypothetical protein [Deltaproteobacteria bacterium]
MSRERRKKYRIKVTSNSLAFISNNVTEYAAAFSAAILDVSEGGVGFGHTTSLLTAMSRSGKNVGHPFSN